MNFACQSNNNRDHPFEDTFFKTYQYQIDTRTKHFDLQALTKGPPA